MYNRILIANRGEIALRVIRACKELGIETVAVYSTIDKDASYLQLADEAYCIGPPPAAESYLKIEHVIAAAEIGNVEAIHPGYGFLSENSHFNEICRECGIDFIGPTPDAMLMLGDKNRARNLAREAGVPTVPGSEGLIEDDEEAMRVAREIGFPALIKATAGGGGRGMRVAANELALVNAISQARAEAKAAFGDGSVYIEKYVERPRHVEVQVIADQHGNAVHLWERDCSTQRRHQKLIEESPAPRLPQEVREEICAAAVRLIKKANYHNAATVEFIVDQENRFYFIEVNARIQVEHPVTEMVTGIDLIKTQIRVAAGQTLPFQQSDIVHSGCAMECRINAEDPDRNFLPSPGKIKSIRFPGGPGVRFDTHVYQGYSVPPTYDSMVGKLLVHKPTREETIAGMLRALDELRIEGIKTVVPFHQAMLREATFVEGKMDTKFVERSFMKQG
ncbi:MAG TPA: acetyl-CoA carboxylase biotin carboxylase subunit [Pirellulaceae bacterium]|jgi:acetyl-CoA carboxylase biotin carboxylase subunit|nr:acetyl-CoA carboxylase biotin carboxylase subunit [Pirellulaceae bacterium]